MTRFFSMAAVVCFGLVLVAGCGSGDTKPKDPGVPLPQSEEVKTKNKSNMVRDELPPPPFRKE